MNRVAEIKEKERAIRKDRRYNFRNWLRDFIVPSNRDGWKYMIVSGGDVLGKLNHNHSPLTKKRCKVVNIDGVPHTVLEVRNRFIEALERAGDLRAFYRAISSIALDDNDIRTYHYDLWLAAHNLEARLERLRELQRRGSHPAVKPEGLKYTPNKRDAARHYGVL